MYSFRIFCRHKVLYNFVAFFSSSLEPSSTETEDSSRLWVAEQTWDQVFKAETAHIKASIFQESLMESFNYFFPEKIVKFRFNDKPWVTQDIKQLDRKRRRAWLKDKYSIKYKELNAKYLLLCKQGKQKYYDKIVIGLKNANGSQLYSKIKKYGRVVAK